MRLLIFLFTIQLVFSVCIPLRCFSGEMPAAPFLDEIFQIKEFSLPSAIGSTVQVRKIKEFPQKLQPGQRIAVFLEDINQGKHLGLVASFRPMVEERMSGNPVIEVLINEQTVYKNQFVNKPPALNIFIPSTYIEKNANVIQIRNTGMESVEFDHVNLSYFKFPGSGSPISPSKYMSFTETLRDSLNMSSAYQEKLLKFIPSLVMNSINKETFSKAKDNKSTDAASESLHLIKDKRYFDPVSKMPYAPYYGIKASSKLFEGNPVLIPLSLVHANSEKSFSSTSWIAVVNAEGVMTAQVSAIHEGGEDVRLILPAPWNGKTKCRITTGFIPPELASIYPSCEKLKTEEKTVEISNGLFETDFKLGSCTTFRLVKDGVKEPSEILNPDLVIKPTRAFFLKGILKCDMKRQEFAAPLRINIRNPEMASSVLSKNYVISKADATKGDIDGIKGIIPYDKKSTFVEISYPDGKACPIEGVNLYFNKMPEDYREMSFWVYPRIEARQPSDKQPAKLASPIKKITLQFYLENEKGYQFLATDLKPDEWQRIILPGDKFRLPQSDRICVVGDPKLPEYANGSKVSFEFNGFCITGNEHPSYGKSGLRSSRIAVEKEGQTIVLTGDSGKYFEYRCQFKEPADISKAYELNDIKGLKYVYKKDAQILEISGQFPKEVPNISESTKKLLTNEELNLLEKQKSSLLAVKIMLGK